MQRNSASEIQFQEDSATAKRHVSQNHVGETQRQENSRGAGCQRLRVTNAGRQFLEVDRSGTWGGHFAWFLCNWFLDNEAEGGTPLEGSSPAGRVVLWPTTRPLGAFLATQPSHG